VHIIAFRQNGLPDVVQCLAVMPDDTHLAVGLKGGSVKLLDLKQPTKSRTLNFGVPDSNSPTVASLSFTSDAGELVVSIRSGSTVHVYHCSEPFTNPIFSFSHDIGSVRWFSSLP
jgi:WD40 repeat protein